MINRFVLFSCCCVVVGYQEMATFLLFYWVCAHIQQWVWLLSMLFVCQAPFFVNTNEQQFHPSKRQSMQTEKQVCLFWLYWLKCFSKKLWYLDEMETFHNVNSSNTLTVLGKFPVIVKTLAHKSKRLVLMSSICIHLFYYAALQSSDSK